MNTNRSSSIGFLLSSTHDDTSCISLKRNDHFVRKVQSLHYIVTKPLLKLVPKFQIEIYYSPG